MGWTDDRVEVLRRVAKEGGSFSDAARELGVTRNAVAGKAGREGIHFACSEERRAERCAEAMRAVWAQKPAAVAAETMAHARAAQAAKRAPR